VVDTSKLAGLGLTAAEVLQALQTQNVQLPGGKVEQGARDLTLRTYGRVSSPEEFASIPVAIRGGHPVRVGDVARVEDGMADPDTVATFGGEPAVVLQVRKQPGTNTIEVVDLLKEAGRRAAGPASPGLGEELSGRSPARLDTRNSCAGRRRGASGKVENVVVVRSIPLLDGAAITPCGNGSTNP